jgi:hypothetical protein
MITAHGVHGYADGASLNRSDGRQVHRLGRLLRLFLLDLERGPAGVEAAFLAGVVRPLGLMAARARLDTGRRDREVSAAIALSGV